MPDQVAGEGFVENFYELARAPDIEIEQSFLRDDRLVAKIEDHLKNQGITLSRSHPNSLYFDTLDYLLLRRAAVSLRHRLKGKSTCGHNYTAVFGVKYLHEEYQAAADEILGRSLLPVEPGDNPRVRQEIERAGSHEHGQSVLWKDIPPEIGQPIARRLGIDEGSASGLVFYPQFRTVADRQQVRLQFKPRNFLTRQNNIIPFHEVPFVPFVQEKVPGLVCMEMAFDDCLFQFERNVLADDKHIRLGEAEIIASLSDVNDHELILGDFLFRKSLWLMDEIMAKEYENDRYERMEYQPSKASLGYRLNQSSASFAHLIP